MTWDVRRKILPTGALLIALAASGAAPALQSRTRQPALPDGDGAELTRERCLICHGTELISQQRLNRAGWEREADKMIRWGAALTEEEKAAVVDYLARTFPPRKPQAPASDDQGRGIFESRCLACHTALLAQQQRLDRAGWTREVDKMIRWGAAIGDAEKERLVDYLASHSGP